MTPEAQFSSQVEDNIRRMSEDADLGKMSLDWMIYCGGTYGYSYNFSWLGRPVIQYPADTVGLQEIIWRTRPDLIIETGIAHGGSLILSASLLAMLDYTDAVREGRSLNPMESRRKVVGLDIDIRAHNRRAIEAHPLSHLIEMIEGSSTASEIVEETRRRSERYERVMVCLDSNHTHEHVLAELRAYAPLVTPDCYCIVFDTVIEDVPAGWFTDRPWDKGNNPKTAVFEFLRDNGDFEIDHSIHEKLQITVARDGFLKRLG